MIQVTPGLLLIDARALTLLQRIFAAAAPEEGCALLLGALGAEPGTSRVVDVWPCLNRWQPAAERRRRFAIDPREQLLAQKWGRIRGMQVIGAAHSHPSTAPVPSATDREWLVAPALMAIQGLAPEGLRLAFWWLEDGREPRQLPWKMVD